MKFERLFALPTAAACIMLCACGAAQSGVNGSSFGASATDRVAAVESAKTMSDIFSSQYGDFLSTFDTDLYQCAFVLDDGAYLVEVDLSKDVYDKLASSSDEVSILSDVPVSSVRRICDVPSKDEQAKLVGKTGADLVADGFVFDGSSVADGVTYVAARNGYISYMIAFSGEIEADSDKLADAFSDAEVSEVTVAGVSSDVFIGG